MEIVDIATAAWRTSSRCMSNSQCVEVAMLTASVAVRDSTQPDGAILTFPAADWNAFATHGPAVLAAGHHREH
ncbi:DUF397 domain-containing protein [Longispora albida]|uniref:DUF397 domain-containing protein n=1 Tax=Longispora albida TaxID=203523 RepID=UPI00037A3A8C|nr:DUF397 domain-containing protein [Longispora albida]